MPELRTAEQILSKNEQVSDALEHGLITAKTSEQLHQCIKTPIKMAELELKFRMMVQRFGRTAPVPRSPLIRSMVSGLDPDRLAPTDGENVRKLLAEK